MCSLQLVAKANSRPSLFNLGYMQLSAGIANAELSHTRTTITVAYAHKFGICQS
jgi:hypothetical protein